MQETVWVAVGAPHLLRDGRPAGRASRAWDNAQSPALAGAGAGRANTASGTSRVSHPSSPAAFQRAGDAEAGTRQNLDAPPGRLGGTEFMLHERGELALLCHTPPPCLSPSGPCRLLARCSYRPVQALCAAGPLNHSLKGCISFTFKRSYLK